MGLAAWRSALRKDRRLPRAKERFALTIHEPAEFLCGVKTTQRLQSCDRLRSRRMATDADSDAGFPVPRDSKLGDPAGDNADCDWFSHCPRDRVGLRADAGRVEANGVCGRIAEKIGA